MFSLEINILKSKQIFWVKISTALCCAVLGGVREIEENPPQAFCKKGVYRATPR
jgi:hypothetical protein